jgi:hypothetical protein
LRINTGPLIKGNLLEGDTIVTNLAGSGLNLNISYQGGTGNDIVLTVASLNSPPFADAGGPYTVPEGGSIVLDGSGSSDPDQSSASLTYAWDLDGDNVFGEAGETGATPTFSAAGLDGFTGSTFTVKLRVTDDEGEFDVDSVGVSITNVAPDASLRGPVSGLKGDPINFTLGATDVSTADQNAGFTYNIDWDGDGTVDRTVSGADGLVVSHTFATAGSTTVILTATDKDGGTSSQVSHTIEIIQPVNVDVKPGNSKNKVNAKSQGVISVVIYTTADFDAATVVGSSVQLAGVSAAHFALEDGDGDLDLVLHFNTQAVIAALGVDLAAGESITVDAELTGETIDEVMIQGFDTIEFFQPGKGKGKNK